MYADKQLKLGTKPIPALLIGMALPAMLSMFTQAFYNVVDSIFVAQLGESALTAVSLAFPAQMIEVSLFAGMGVGINSGISRRLGQQKKEEAQRVMEHGFIIALFLAAMLGIFGILFAEKFFRLFTDHPGIVSDGRNYLSIVMVFSFGVFITQAGASALQATGDMIKPMISQLIGAITNIILDPIMIFGLLGFPRMGVTGAAIATVIGQVCAMIYILFTVFVRRNNVLQPEFRHFRLDKAILKDIVRVGLPSSVMQSIGSLMVTGFNMILTPFGLTAIAVFGVYFKIQSFIFMPVFGLNQGAMPILGYNYGAGNQERFSETIQFAMKIASLFMVVGLAIFQLFPNQLFGIFNASETMLEIGPHALRAISISFPLVGVSIILSSAFLATGKSYVTMIASFFRQMILLLPAAYLLAQIGGLQLVWFSFLIAEIFSVIYLIINYRRKITMRFPEKYVVDGVASDR